MRSFEEQEKNRKQRLLDKEIDIRINLRNVTKFSALAIVVVLIFCLGKWSASPVCSPETISAATVSEGPIESAPEKSDSFSLSGFITGLVPSFLKSDEVDTETAPVAEEDAPESEETVPESEETAPEVNETSTEIPETNETAEEEEEVIITSYSKVSLAVKKAKIDWKGTWGKITHLDFTIKNNEAGTIKPSYFTMVVEGYGDDILTKVPLPTSSKSIPAKKSLSSTAVVPKGFSYNEITTGDLTKVELIIRLYDSSDKLITSFKKEFDLSG